MGGGAVQPSDCIQVETVFQSGCYWLDAAQPPSGGWGSEQFVCKVGGVTEDAAGFFLASVGVDVPDGW